MKVIKPGLATSGSRQRVKIKKKENKEKIKIDKHIY